MRTAYLDINDKPVDLPASLKGVFRLQNLVAALQELETRTGEYAWPLTLPFSRRNDAVFGQIRHAAALDKFAGAYTFRLRVGGQQWAGVWRLLSLKNGYQGQLIMDGFGWALALGQKKLTDLTTLPAVEYDGTQLESILAKTCDETDVQFPLMSFGNFFSPPRQQVQSDGSTADAPSSAAPIIDYPLSVDDYYPAVYEVNLVRAILREAGYFAQGPVLDEPDVRTWCVTAAGGDSTKWPWGALLPATSNGTAATPGQNQFSYFASGPGDGYTNTAVGFQNPAGVGNINGYDLSAEVCFLPVPAPTISRGGTRALNGSTSAYTAPRPGTYDFAWSAQLISGHRTVNYRTAIPFLPDVLLRFLRVELALVVRRSGADFDAAGLFDSGSVDSAIIPAHNSMANSFAGSIGSQMAVIPGTFSNSASVYLDAGDVAQLCVVMPRRFFDITEGEAIYQSEFNIGFGAVSFACTHYADDNGVSETKLSPVAMLPPLSQQDVLRDFLVRNNALLTTDPERGTATIDFREGHRTAQGPPVDLTGLLNPDDYEPLPVMGSAESMVFEPADAGDDAFVAPAPGFEGADVVTIPLASAAAVPGTTKRVTGTFAATAQRLYSLPGSQAEIPTAANTDALKTPRSETSWDVGGTAPRVVRYLGQSAAGVLLPFQQRSVRFGLAEYGGPLAWGGDTGAVAVRYAESMAQARRGHRLRVPALLTPSRYRELSPGRRVWAGVAEYTVESITGFDCCDEASAAQLELLRVV